VKGEVEVVMVRSLVAMVVLFGVLACAGSSAPSPAPAPAAPAPGLASADDPAETVRRVYELYQGKPTSPAPWLPAASAQLARSWGVATMEAEDACGVPAIYQSDVIVDAQDHQISAVQVKAKKAGEKATATARFENFGKPHSVEFDLVYEEGAWRIDDVRPTGASLQVRIRDTVVAGDGC
jgi:hypothetical protein